MRGGEIDAMTARKQFGGLLDSVYYQGQSFTIERNGKKMAAVVPLTVLNAYQQAMVQLEAIAGEHRKVNKQTGEKQREQDILAVMKAMREKK